MRAGRLRYLIEIQTPTEVQAEYGFGGPTIDWTDTVTPIRAWASIEPVSGAEYTNAMQQQANVTHMVRLRHPGSTITPKQRLAWGSRTFEIVAALNRDERNIEWELQCKELV